MTGVPIQWLARTWSPLWPDWTHLIPVADSPGWVIDEEMRSVGTLARSLGIRVVSRHWLRFIRRQCVFYGSHFFLLDNGWRNREHRIATAYFHGRPGTGVPEFDEVYRHFCKEHRHIDRVQVSHSEMEQIVRQSGIAPEKVFRIPIGIDPTFFMPATPTLRRSVRRRLGLPEAAFVVGSFQKDGVGWAEGKEPKLIKGPDVLLRVLAILKTRVPELWVLLSGPARGYVKAGLERLGIPYRHCYLKQYKKVGRLYHALDAYLVASRQEGGPKAVLESMASGIPFVTTRVGQAMDLVRHGENGWMVPIDDTQGLAHWLQWIREHETEAGRVCSAGLVTAAENTYESQRSLWKNFFKDFVTGR